MVIWKQCMFLWNRLNRRHLILLVIIATDFHDEVHEMCPWLEFYPELF